MKGDWCCMNDEWWITILGCRYQPRAYLNVWTEIESYYISTSDRSDSRNYSTELRMNQCNPCAEPTVYSRSVWKYSLVENWYTAARVLGSHDLRYFTYLKWNNGGILHIWNGTALQTPGLLNIVLIWVQFKIWIYNNRSKHGRSDGDTQQGI